jgi:hypothetical protein
MAGVAFAVAAVLDVKFDWFSTTSQSRESNNLPSELGELSELEVLNIRQNTFEGAFPSEISDIPGLLALWLDRNDLSSDFTTQCNVHDRLFISADCAEILCPFCSICCHGKKNATTCTYKLDQVHAISQLDSFASSFCLVVPSDPISPLRLALQWSMTQSRPKSCKQIALATLFFSTTGENWADFIRRRGMWMEFSVQQ